MVVASREQAPQPATNQLSQPATDEPASRKPSFDIVRVEPTGDSVIAGRGAPNTEVVLLDRGKVIARGRSDANGQVALLPPPLAPGEHSLMLSMTVPGAGEVVSSQSVVVSVPEQPRTAPMVALIQPNSPAAILSGPVAGAMAPAPSGGGSPRRAAPLTGGTAAIRSVEVESMGSFYATGKASPGSIARVYLNGAFVATVTADPSGTWSLQIKKGMKPGRYAVRLDEMDGAGKVTARAEVPFDYPTQVATATLRADAGKKNTAAPANTITGDIASAGTGADGLPDPGTSRPGKAPSSGGAPEPVASAQAPPSGSAVDPASSPGKPARNTAVATAEPAGTGTSASSVPSADIMKLDRPPTAPRPAPGSSSATTAAGSETSAAPDKTVPAASKPSDATASAAETDDDSFTPTIVAELITAKVIHGDSLWRISRQMLGHGVRYTQIYAANTQQIRDPRLIYPGQVFVMPQH